MSLQWLVFIVGAIVLSSVLRHVPGLGGLFRGLWGFWISVLLLSAATTWLSKKWVEHLRVRRSRLEFARVDNPHNQGKLGTVLLQQGRPREAVRALELAVAGDSASAEWHYRLGSALRRTGEPARAVQELEAALQIAPAHAWGDVGIELALARQAIGDDAGALEALRLREREHGESVRGAYLRGTFLRRIGKRDEARAAFKEVSEIARLSPRFSRRGTLKWRALSMLAGLR